ncbi:MMPL family transporter [Streptomyces sp. NPDC091972]|uniref:MMPL family transporter n=1 Tax=Streptomyces sp. NPDC091972 TaxID=3366007 RepID=UPI00381EF8BD
MLFLAFGTLLGMLVPLLVATAGVGAGMLTIGLLSRTTTLGTIAPTVAALIGLGVAIDYALFIVVRYRAGLHTGLSPQEAALRVQNTSGRAVLFAGGTVIVALLGMFTLRITPLTGVGLAAVITVLFTVLAAMTLLPALLDVFGTRLLTRRQRRRLSSSPPGSVDTRAETATSAGSRYRWSHLVNRHKAAFSVVAPVVLTVLSLPALSLRLGTADAANDPAGTTTRRAYDLLADGFGPGTNGPLLRVSPMHGPDDTAGLNRLAATVRHLPEIASAQVTPTSTCGAGVWDGSTSSPPDSAASAGASTRSSSRARSFGQHPATRRARPGPSGGRSNPHFRSPGAGGTGRRRTGDALPGYGPPCPGTAALARPSEGPGQASVRDAGEPARQPRTSPARRPRAPHPRPVPTPRPTAGPAPAPGQERRDRRRSGLGTAFRSAGRCHRPNPPKACPACRNPDGRE